MAHEPNHVSILAKQGIVGLPAEIREEIYGYYFRLGDGYNYNPVTKKNATALRTVNKLIAEETRDFVVKYNEIHFTTVRLPLTDPDSWPTHDLLTELSNAQDRASRRVLTMSDWYDDAARAYVQANHAPFLPLLDHAKTLRSAHVDRYREQWKEVPSVTRHFIRETLDTIRLRFGPGLVAEPSEQQQIYLRRVLTASQGQPIEPCCIPTDTELDAMQRNADTLRLYDLFPHGLDDQFAEDRKRFSAAAVAIRYMKSLRPEARKKLRRIVLDEDDASIAWPECHAQGLIPFCQENGQLRIDRRIDMWKIMFARSWNVMATTSSQTIAPWLMEAIALRKFGMPLHAFKLTFIGDTNPTRATQILNVALKDAAWQAALERCTSTNPGGLLHPAIIRTSPTFIMAGFPRAMQDVANGTSMVRCNFPIGSLPDENEVPEEHLHWALDDWGSEWNASRTEINTSDQWPSYQAVIDLTFVPNAQASQATNDPIVIDVPGYPNDHTPIEIPLAYPEHADIE